MERRHVLGIVAVLVVFLGLSVYKTQMKLHRDSSGIMLYDQLSTVQSQIGFRDALTGLCEGKTSEFVYRNASQVTVNLLKHPPRKRVLVMRMHSGVFENNVWVFTGEGYSESKHVMDQVRGFVHIAHCSSTSEVVFAVGEDFFDENWSDMDGTLVVLMGCSSLGYTGLAEIMVDKVAVGVIGWSDEVSVELSDSAVLRIMSSLYEGRRLGEIVEEINETMNGSLRMRYYPDSLSGFRLFEP